MTFEREELPRWFSGRGLLVVPGGVERDPRMRRPTASGPESAFQASGSSAMGAGSGSSIGVIVRSSVRPGASRPVIQVLSIG